MNLICSDGIEVANGDQNGLRCELDGRINLEGKYEGVKVVCCPEKASFIPTRGCFFMRIAPAHVRNCLIQNEVASELDTEASNISCKVFSGSGELLHEGTAKFSETPSRQPTRRKSMKDRLGALYPFAIISFSYLLFTITDGAVRMIVLLHAYQQHFSALDVAIMFTLYEVAGVVTNLAAGMLGARWGIKTTLLSGLGVQLAGLGMLFGWQNDWSKAQAIIYVTASQMLCGVAKDLTKLGGKTVTKLVTPEGKNSKLFKLVSLITGWKNSLKGVGYFLGAATVGVK